MLFFCGRGLLVHDDVELVVVDDPVVVDVGLFDQLTDLVLGHRLTQKSGSIPFHQGPNGLREG